MLSPEEWFAIMQDNLLIEYAKYVKEYKKYIEEYEKTKNTVL